MPPFSPFHGYPSLFFLFPVGTLDENHATAQKTFPHYGMDTSQQPRDENKITHKNSLFLSWCILLALCFAFVSAAPAAAGPNPAKYDKAIRDMGQLQKSKKRLQREPWEKLAETFLTVYRVEKKWKERSAALFRSAEALDHLARCASNAKDARRSVDRYLQLVRLYPKSSLADDSLYRAAQLRGQILRDKAGAQELLQQILKKYPSSNTAKDASSYLATLSPKEKRQSPSAASKASKQKQPRGKPFRLGVKTVLIDPGHGGKDPGTHHRHQGKGSYTGHLQARGGDPVLARPQRPVHAPLRHMDHAGAEGRQSPHQQGRPVHFHPRQRQPVRRRAGV